MELWLIFAIISSVFSGLSGFILKMVAKRNYNSEVHIFYSALFSIILSTLLVLFFEERLPDSFVIGLALLSGLVASLSGIFKVYALRYIDTTIYFPLFKLVSPLIAIILGILLFQETFSKAEWVGLILSLFVPLLLITKAENHRQNNLLAGILLILFTGALSAATAGINKYIAIIHDDFLWILVFASIGVFVGSIFVSLYKNGFSKILSSLGEHTNRPAVELALLRSVIINSSFFAILYSFSIGGTLAVVYTIASMYILIPIILAIIFYNEHWNVQKVTAVVLSIVALGFFA